MGKANAWVLLAALLGTMDLSHAASVTVSDGTYNIYSKFSKNVLDVEGSSKDNNAKLVESTYSPSQKSQEWIVQHRGDGYYSVLNGNSGAALDVVAKSLEDGARVSQYEYNGGANQLWEIREVEAGYMALFAKHSGKALDRWSPAGIQQYAYWGADNQLWALKLASGAAPPVPVPAVPTPAPVPVPAAPTPAPVPVPAPPTGCGATLEGFGAMNGGTTGGGNGKRVTVKTLSELKSAAKSSSPMVIVISGTIDMGSSAVTITSHKTIVGEDKSATVKGGFTMKNVKNVIIRNLRIVGKGKNASPADTLAARGSTNLWFDHLEVSDAGDGLLDITNESDFVTVSYCKFYYTDSSNGHRLASLNGSGGGTRPSDWGKLRVTYHHNWWGKLVDQRMPRMMYGHGHDYNNYFTATGNSYCIGVGSYGAVLVENNYFKKVNDPHKFMYDVFMDITARGNIYDGTSGRKDTGRGGSRKVDGQDFDVVAFTKAPYKYTLNNAADVPSLVERCAGPQ